MRIMPCQSQSIGIWLAAGQQQIWLDVAFSISSPITTQQMIAIILWQRLIDKQQFQNPRQQRTHILTVARRCHYTPVGIGKTNHLFHNFLNVLKASSIVKYGDNRSKNDCIPVQLAQKSQRFCCVLALQAKDAQG
jgi:hypothetical protein